LQAQEGKPVLSALLNGLSVGLSTGMARQASYAMKSRICSVEIIVTLIRLTLAAGLALALTAYASKPPKPMVDSAPDCNFRHPKTIGFYGMIGKVTGNNPTNSPTFSGILVTQRCDQHSMPGAWCSPLKRLILNCYSIGI